RPRRAAPAASHHRGTTPTPWRRRATAASGSTSSPSSTCWAPAEPRRFPPMPLVAGVASSTQSCKVVIRDAETGELVRQGRAAHPEGTEVHPDHWWTALSEALAQAGGLDDVAAVAVGGQQHGMVVL